MLVLQREKGEKIVLADGLITITVVEVRGGSKVRLGIEAPKDIPVHREEIFEAIQREQANAQGDVLHESSGVVEGAAQLSRGQ